MAMQPNRSGSAGRCLTDQRSNEGAEALTKPALVEADRQQCLLLSKRALWAEQQVQGPAATALAGRLTFVHDD